MTAEMTENAGVFSDEEIVEIARDVWSSFVGSELEPLDPSITIAEDEDKLTGCVQITGAWQGSVLIAASEDVGRAAASAMFEMTEDELSADEVTDAFGELTNMIGGNLKSLVPQPSTLSTPSVAVGSRYEVKVPGAVRLNHLGLLAEGRVITVSVWRV